MHQKAPAPGTTTMELSLKIWRYDPESGERELKHYDVEAPDWATLLDVLDIVKERYDGSLARRAAVRMRGRTTSRTATTTTTCGIPS